MPLAEPLEDGWSDYSRSLRRRGRSDKTIDVYRRSFERFFSWALDNGTPPDPAAVTIAGVNAFVDYLRDEVSAQTTVIYWRNVRPFFAWWSREVDAPNPFAKADVPATPDTLNPVVSVEDCSSRAGACPRRAG
jgi:site-specific recombinase XerD